MNIFEELKYSGFIKDVSSSIEDFQEFIEKEEVVAYCGFDLTAKSLQIGNLLPILNLRKLLKHNKKIIILLGRATTKIGDPSGRDDMRKMLTDEQIEENKKSILYCISKFINLKHPNVRVVENLDWFQNKGYLDFLQEIGTYFTINKMINLDIVKQRLDKNLPMTFLEFNYMIMQGYDFYHLHEKFGCNLQIGGSDQWGNIIQGLELIRLKKNAQKKEINKIDFEKHNQQDVFIYTIPLLLKADGTKMGKTAGGAVWLHEDLFSSYDYFQYWRNVNDEDVIRFLKIFTDLTPNEIDKYEKYEFQELNEVKNILAFEATKMRDGEITAQECLKKSLALFSNQDKIDLSTIKNEDYIIIQENINLIDLIINLKLELSRTKIKNLIESGAVKINEEKILDINFNINKNNTKDKFILRIGKNKIFFIRF